MAESKTYRFALIGCGRIVRKHIEALKALPNAALVAVCDLVGEKAARIAGELGIKHYADYHDMLKHEKLDVVSVLTESGLHGQIVTDIARYGKHIIVEKPMALTLEDADRMIKECAENNIKLP